MFHPFIITYPNIFPVFLYNGQFQPFYKVLLNHNQDPLNKLLELF